MVQLTDQTAFERMLFRDEMQRYCAHFGDYRLHSVFQPILDRAGHLIGYEALLRVSDAHGQALRPDIFFQNLAEEDQIDADRLARVIHLRNFAQARVPGFVSLNLMPQTVLHDHGYRSNFDLMIKRCAEIKLDASRIYLEILEHEIEQGPAELASGLLNARKAGFKIAIDDFGTLASSLSRVHALQPDVIKIDRSLLLDYMADQKPDLKHCVEESRKIQSLSLVEGIETAEQLDAMQQLNIDLYQGFYLSRPSALEVNERVD